MTDSFDWVDSVEEEDDEVLVQVPEVRSARDFIKRKIKVKQETNESPEYTRGYRDGYYAATQEQKSKYFKEGYAAALKETALPS